MKRLIQWSIDHHWMVLGLAVLLAVAGAWTARSMPVDVFPDLTAPTVTILAEGHGALRKWKRWSLFRSKRPSTGPRTSGVSAATAVGVAVVWVEFDWVRHLPARQIVAEKLARAGPFRHKSNGRSWRPSRPSWARSCSSRSRPTVTIHWRCAWPLIRWSAEDCSPLPASRR